MPGITGIICSQTARRGERSLLQAMHECMLHESFYRHGTYVDESMGVYVGHVSIKGTFADCMPIENEAGDIALFVCGECFLDETAIASLRARDHRLSPANAQAIVHLYEEHGEKAVADLNGWISGLLIDKRQKRVLLFNDRMGTQRVYYHENSDGFYFSSEAKSLLRVLPETRAIDPLGVAEYLRYDCVLDDRTCFRQIHVLPSGSVWSWSNGGLKKKHRFDPRIWENQPALSPDEFLSQGQEAFIRAVQRCTRNQDVSLALTGGLDTRLILACNKAQPARLPCFTFTSARGDSFDARLARRLARATDQEHHVFRLGEEFLGDYPAQVERAIYVTDGQADATTADGLYLNGLARALAPAKLTGKFGSQVLGGIMALRDRSPEPTLIHPQFRCELDRAGETFSSVQRDCLLTHMLFQEIPWYWARYTVAETSQLMVRSPFLDHDLVSLCYRIPAEIRSSRSFHFQSIANWNPLLHGIRTNTGRYGAKTPVLLKPAGLWFRMTNMASKAYNWERLPKGIHHWIARADPWLSALRVDGPLLSLAAFGHYRAWFRTRLSGYVREILLDNRTLQRPYWDRAVLERILVEHLAGRRNYLAELKKILTLELIHRVLLERMDVPHLQPISREVIQLPGVLAAPKLQPVST